MVSVFVAPLRIKYDNTRVRKCVRQTSRETRNIKNQRLFPIALTYRQKRMDNGIFREQLIKMCCRLLYDALMHRIPTEIIVYKLLLGHYEMLKRS